MSFILLKLVHTLRTDLGHQRLINNSNFRPMDRRSNGTNTHCSTVPVDSGPTKTKFSFWKPTR